MCVLGRISLFISSPVIISQWTSICFVPQTTVCPHDDDVIGGPCETQHLIAAMALGLLSHQCSHASVKNDTIIRLMNSYDDAN